MRGAGGGALLLPFLRPPFSGISVSSPGQLKGSYIPINPFSLKNQRFDAFSNTDQN